MRDEKLRHAIMLEFRISGKNRRRVLSIRRANLLELGFSIHVRSMFKYQRKIVDFSLTLFNSRAALVIAFYRDTSLDQRQNSSVFLPNIMGQYKMHNTSE